MPSLRFAFARHLESPGVVPEIRSPKKTRLGEVDEVSVDGRLVHPQRCHLLDQIVVRQGLFDFEERLVNTNAARSGPKPRIPDSRSNLLAVETCHISPYH